MLHGGAPIGAAADDAFGHAPGAVCPLYDQLSSGDAGAPSLPAVLSHAPPQRPLAAAQPASHEAALAAAFLARAPPSFSA